MSLNGITANGTKIEDVVINLLSSGVAASSDPPSVIVDGDQSEYWDGLLSLSVRLDVVAKNILHNAINNRVFVSNGTLAI